MAEIITPEAQLEERSFVTRAMRFIDALPLIRRFLPLCLAFLLAGSAAPNLFRWFTGKFVTCMERGECHAEVVHLSIPISVGTLSLVVVLCVFLNGTASFLIDYLGKASTLILYGRVLDGLNRVRVTFFDENPSGRIRKRLTEDYARIRNYAIWDSSEAASTFCDILAAVGLIAMTSPVAAIGVIPIAGLLILIQRRDMASLFQARSERIALTGVVAQTLNDLLEGKSTFQLYGREEAMRSRVAQAYSHFFSANARTTTLMAANRFKTVAVAECYSAAVIATVGSAAASGYFSIATAGVVISAVFGLSAECRFLAMLASFISTHFAASERMLAYTRLEGEEKGERKTGALYTLGSKGAIVFSNFTSSYRQDTPVVLSRIDLSIPIGKKTALMGRSGCGKSTLVQALLRMLYIHEGDILINGTSIYGISASDHRESFSIVPQYPYLFAGSVRENLDKSLSISEVSITEALHKVGLSLKPDFQIREGGDNLSMGERQLLSLARAIIRDRPILLMDEPTSLIDVATDQKIQEVLRSEFSRKTVITIAHRTETIEDYDYAILMDRGRVIRTGTSAEIREEARRLPEAA